MSTIAQEIMETSTKSSVSRVLVVEDEPDIAALIAYQLTREGFRVETAGSGTEALDAVGREVPDLIVLDRMLPGVSGDDVLRRLKGEATEAAAGRGRRRPCRGRRRCALEGSRAIAGARGRRRSARGRGSAALPDRHENRRPRWRRRSSPRRPAVDQRVCRRAPPRGPRRPAAVSSPRGAGCAGT